MNKSLIDWLLVEKERNDPSIPEGIQTDELPMWADPGDLSDIDDEIIIDEVVRRGLDVFHVEHKHLSGKHNQKKHGWRFGTIAGVRQSMQGMNDIERDEYRRKAGMKPLVRVNKASDQELVRELEKRGYKIEKPKIVETIKQKIFNNLDQEIEKVGGENKDDRFKDWAKEITGLDESQTNGFMFKGDFVRKGTTEVRTEKPKVFLSCTTSGSAKYNNSYYRVVAMLPGGNLMKTKIKTFVKNSDRTTAGWALRIRDSVRELLQDIGSMSPEEITKKWAEPEA